MGIQELKDVTLIRHAYTFSTYQGMGLSLGIGVALATKRKNYRLFNFSR